MNPDNCFQWVLHTLTLIFMVSLLNGNECWCSTPWQWQIGAFSVFFSWLNFIFVLKYMPYAASPINMFLSICVAFLRLIFLPILLILAFGVPFYMVFVKVSCLGCAMGVIITTVDNWHEVNSCVLTTICCIHNYMLYSGVLKYTFPSYSFTGIWKPDCVHISQSSHSEDLCSASWRV